MTKAILAGGAALGLVIAFMLYPETLPSLRCPFHELTGHSCFTCGLTRSVSAMLHGNVQASLHYHLMGPIVSGGMMLAGILWVAEASTGRRFIVGARATRRRNTIVGFALLWIVFGGVRLLTELM